MTHLERIKELYTAGEHRSLIEYVDSESINLANNAAALVWKSRSLQLLADGPEDALLQIEACLTRALELDDEHRDALVELGYFYLRLLDDAARARPLFEKSLRLSREAATESVIGIAECIYDLESPEAATTYLDKNGRIALDTDKIEEEREFFL